MVTKGKGVASVKRMDKSFIDSVISSASQGAAGAVIGAFLAAVSDPITNRLLVKRMTLAEALADVEISACIQYFQTTLPTNFIKFPVFEVLNTLTQELPAETRGLVAGVVFTTATLPLTNFRFAKSMNQPVSSISLFKAYLPTVVRDVVYAQARNWASGKISEKFPALNTSAEGRILAMFLTVVFACLVSSPGNEWRGYTLQPEASKKSVGDFFQLARYLRSTLVGAVVMGTSLGVATLVGPHVQKNKKLLLGVFVAILAAKKIANDSTSTK